MLTIGQLQQPQPRRNMRLRGVQHLEGGGIAGGSNNGNKIGAAHDDTRSGGGGNQGGGNKNQGGNAPAPGVRNQDTGSFQSAADSTGSEISRQAGNFGRPRSMGNSTTADRGIMDKYEADPSEKIPDDRAFLNAISHLGQRYNDYKNRGNSSLDNLGNFALGSLGIGEMDPTRQALGDSQDTDDATWGGDPLSAALGVAGVLTGAPLQTVYNGIKYATDYPGPQIAFDGKQYLNYGFKQSPIAQGNGTYADGSTPGGALGSLGGVSGPAGSAGGPGKPGSDTIGSLSASSGTSGNTTSPSPATAAPNQDATTVPTIGTVASAYPGDPLTYGQTGGEWLFAQPSPSAPTRAPVTNPLIAPHGPVNMTRDPVTGQLIAPHGNVQMKKGGAATRRLMQMPGLSPMSAMAARGAVAGPGDGQSDDVPAMLSNGEHVLDASLVSAIGAGSNEAGHKKIEEWKQSVRRKVGYKNSARIPHKVPAIQLGVR